MKKTVNLFIDTSQARCNLAIFDNKKIIKKSSCLTHNNLTDLVVEKIDKLIKGYDISNIYITIGPGSFTGERVSCLIAKSWILVKNVNVYVIDSLAFQLPLLNGISIIDAKTNRSYVCVYKNKKCVIKPKIILNNELEKIIKKYKSLPIYKDYKNVDVFKNLIELKKYFTQSNLEEIVPLYLKDCVYGKNNK